MEEQSQIENDLHMAFDPLPTGKRHISFSELRDWQECSYRHKIKFVDGINPRDSSPFLDFGTAVHESCEDFIKTGVMKPELSEDFLRNAFEKGNEEDGFNSKLLEEMVSQSNSILSDVPKFMNETFGQWEYVDAEHYLYELASEKHSHAFKGFIDAIIKTKNKKGKDIYWLIDWKTTVWGWKKEKKSDPDIARQLVFYKSYWSQKTGINPRDVRCAFVLLKRTAKSGNHCELLTISVGPTTTSRSLKIVNNMLSSVKRGISLKNKSNCKYCPFSNTEHCT